MRVMILGASYGSLLSTKLLMAGHDVSLVCREATASLINNEGTEVILKLKDEDKPRSFLSKDFNGRLDAVTPDAAAATLMDYDMIFLAMQEPQYSSAEVGGLMRRIAATGKPCVSIMNMPPLAYLRRVEKLNGVNLDACYDDPGVWADFAPGKMTLCSPDPQAARLPDRGANVLSVGLPTNFKAAVLADAADNAILRQLETDIAAVTIEGKDVPVKLRVHDSLFVPMAKWSMLLTGNYRCILDNAVCAIRDAIHGDLEKSAAVYAWVDELARKLGAAAEDQVPFEKYAKAGMSLLKPSSAARAIDGGAKKIERVDRLVQTIGRHLGMENPDIDAVVATVDKRLAQNNSG